MPTSEAYTISQLIESPICPIRRTRIVQLINNGIKFQNGKLTEGENYIIAWKSGPNSKASWIIDRSEFENFKTRAKKL